MAPVFPIFVGSGRSGTTLFRNIFDSHPEMAMTHEAHFILPMAQRRRRYEAAAGFDTVAFLADLYANSNWVRQGVPEPEVRSALAAAPPGDYAAAVRRVFAAYAARQGKPRYGDKTPGYVTHLGLLGSLFPEARFVHIVRDGRDVAMAYLDREEWGPGSLVDAALYWRSRVGRGRAAGRELGPERYLEVRYEDMVDDPEGITRRLCGFVDLAYDDAMLRYHERGRAFIATTADPQAFQALVRPITKGLRDWRTQMAADDVALFEAVAGDLLASLGYDLTEVACGLTLKSKVKVAEAVWLGKRVVARARPLLRRLRSTGRHDTEIGRPTAGTSASRPAREE